MAITKLHALSKDIDMGSTAFYKLVGLTLGLVANFGAVAIVTRQFGITEYATYALVASFLFLLPFADLGIGAGVVNAISDLRAGSITATTANKILARSRVILFGVSAILIGLAASLWINSGWSYLLGSLGNFQPATQAATATVLAVAIALPFGIGSRMLQGQGLVRLNVQLGLINPICNVLLLTCLVLFSAPIDLYLLVPGASYLVVTIVTYIIARRVSGIRPEGWIPSCYRGATAHYPLMRMALPFCIVSVGTALGLQSHRLILAHVSDPSAVASYSFVAQFAGPISAVLITSGQNLWSKYRNHSSGSGIRNLFHGHLLLFLTLGLVAASTLMVTIPVAERILTAGQVQTTYGLLAGAAFYIVVVSVHQPGSMFLTDTAGLYGQALMVIVMSITSILAMIMLAPQFGASVAYYSSAVAMLVFQVFPSWLVIFTRFRRNAGNELRT